MGHSSPMRCARAGVQHVAGWLQAKHRISCIRTAIKRNMDVQNYAFAKRMLDLLVAKAPPNKQGEFKVLISVCTQVRNTLFWRPNSIAPSVLGLKACNESSRLMHAIRSC